MCKIIGLIVIMIINVVMCVRIEKSAYHDIVIEIDSKIDYSECTKLFLEIENSFKKASQFLLDSLDGRAYFAGIIIVYPDNWPATCVPHNQSTIPSSGDTSDITIIESHPIYNDQVWTKQYGGCGDPGLQIYLTPNSIQRTTIGKEIVREWAKYRYGVFDEIGYANDKVYPKCYTYERGKHVTGCLDLPFINENEYCNDDETSLNDTVDEMSRKSILYSAESASISMFCDEGTHNKLAPTKHNFFCNHQSVLDVILQSNDFNIENMLNYEPSVVLNTTPKFTYHKRLSTRYIIVVDETQDILQRESWNFLRNAIRKWVVYDLPDNTEVGVVLLKENNIDSVLELTPLLHDKRDNIASFFPFSPSEKRQYACIVCGISKAVEMLNRQNESNGPANSIIVLVAPGMSTNTEYLNVTNYAKRANIRITTINYPGIIRREPLDPIAQLTSGKYYTVYETRQNIDKSLLTTYFELTNVLYQIGYENYEGNKLNFPIEIHRKELISNLNEEDGSISKKYDTKNITGSFFLDSSMSSPSGFYIYTHNVEQPLIEGLKLISPCGKIFSQRSDSRLFNVKQITLSSNINETGSWTYSMYRILGNPQPHYVQVLATPVKYSNNVITVQSWIKTFLNGPIIIYVEVRKGDLPVLSADVEATITRPDALCNDTIECSEKMLLFDNGAGEPDIMEGDGIYSRYFNPESNEIYRFVITVTDKRNTAYTMGMQNVRLFKEYQKCCGSRIPTPIKQTLPSFQRILPAHTMYLQKNQSIKNSKTYGRIGDLRGELLNKTKVRLTWTSPDMGGSNVARYEVKYSTRLSDIIVNYDTGAINWNYDQPFVYSIGDLTTFTMNLTNDIDQLYGENLYIAIRAFSYAARDALIAPTSNWINIYIPNLNRGSNTYNPRISSGGIDDGNVLGTDQSIYSSDHIDKPVSNISNNINNIGLIILISLILLIVLFSAIIIFIIYLKRRGKKSSKILNDRNSNNSKKKLKLKIEQQNNQLILAQQQEQNKLEIQQQQLQNQIIMDGDTSSPHHHQHHHHQHYHSNMDNTDHHTIGLPPICTSTTTTITTDCDYNYKRYSIVNQNEQQLIDELKMHNSNRILSPYESWTASQLLHEHERRISPGIDDHLSITTTGTGTTTTQYYNHNDSTSMNQHHQQQIPPPVPPLPYVSNIIYPIQNGLPFNPSLQGSICSVNSGGGDNLTNNKKRRNVTMV